MDFLETNIMDDARRAYAPLSNWPDPETITTSADLIGASVPEPAPQKQKSTDEKALDRWFREQRGKKRVLKRLDIPNEMLVTTGGPMKVTGNITLINEDGSVTHSNNLNLCRCGASNNKPLCDDQHLDIEFFDSGAITKVSDSMPVKRPQTITLTCVKNGPIKFRGYLRIYNNKGQECITMNGALCRCGKSSNKPFCDSQCDCGVANRSHTGR